MEKVIVLLDNSSTRIERIYSYGEVSPIEVEGKEIFMNKGDELFLPRHAKHRINYTSDNCVWYCVFKKY
jgi:cupin 2 domain-containing protein